MGTFSFHETKNITSAGEGGLLIINDEKFTQRAEIIREKGTNRSQFFRGMVDKYSWVDIGSSYLMNDVSAAYLWGQLEKIENIQKDRLKSWNRYYNGLKELEQKRLLELPKIPSNCQNNAHIFYIKVKNLEQRASLIRHLKENDICAVFHYVPLHSSPAGVRFGRFDGVDTFTTKESEKIIRLPIYYRLDDDRLEYILKTIKCFFGSNDG
jgi:dTDP-4-amino-4,6-dideoxygalactose transaminase